jgi:hypothetical protein
MLDRLSCRLGPGEVPADSGYRAHHAGGHHRGIYRKLLNEARRDRN